MKSGRPLPLVALFVALLLFMAIPLLAQDAPNAPRLNTAGKLVVIAVGVAATLQAIKGVVNRVRPELLKGRAAVVLQVALSAGAAFAALDPSTVDWSTILLALFGSGGVFATAKALLMGQK